MPGAVAGGGSPWHVADVSEGTAEGDEGEAAVAVGFGDAAVAGVEVGAAVDGVG